MSYGVVPTGDPGGYQSNYGGYRGGFWDTYNPISYGADDYEYQNDGINVKGSGRDYWFNIGDTRFDYYSENGGSSSSSNKRKVPSSGDGPVYPTPGKKPRPPTLVTPGGIGLGGPVSKLKPIGPVFGPMDGGSQLSNNNSKMAGRAVHGFPGPFRTKRVNAILGEEMHETRKIYLKRLSGRIIPDVKWRSANKFKAVTMMFGDVLAENDTTVPVEDVDPLQQGGDTGAIKDNFALATTQVIWGTNRYGDICLSNCMPAADGSGNSAGVADSVINKKFLLSNIWSGVTNRQGGNRVSLPGLAAINSSEYSSNAVWTSFLAQQYPAVAVNSAGVPSGLEALFKYETEVVVSNPMNYACQVEAYLIVPKYENYSQTPMLFWESSESEAAYEGIHAIGDNGGPPVLGATGEQWRPPIQEVWKNDLSRSPTQSVAFNNRYRVIDKKTVVVGSGHTTKFCSSVPWSLIKRDIVESVPTLKGVTHFIWLRLSSPQLYNNDSHALVNTNGTVLVQQFERIAVKPVEPVFIPKTYNFIKFAGENSTTIAQNQLINPDGNAVTPGAKLSMDVV